MELNKEEKKILFDIARNSILSGFDKNVILDIDFTNYPKLQENHGAFVTLKLNGNLKGCIGYILSEDPLYKTVERAAYQAAFNDYRFSPLTEDEFEKVKLEISVLSIPFKMNSYDEIEIGKHGLILREGFHQGLLLPQVPIEHNMNKEEYLSALCQKAGLYSEYWKEKTLNIEMFTALVFSEEEEND